MFTVVVTRPRYNEAGECVHLMKNMNFSIHIPRVSKEKKYKEREGTLITKVVESVKQKVTRKMLIDRLLQPSNKSGQNMGPQNNIHSTR